MSGNGEGIAAWATRLRDICCFGRIEAAFYDKVPVVSRVSVSRGGRLLYQLSERATVALVLDRRAARGGYSRVGRVVRPSQGRGSHGESLRSFTGGEPLPSGLYRATLRAVDGVGNRSASKALRFVR
jgi:hypothetical protein